jgi:hypothetical protein
MDRRIVEQAKERARRARESARDRADRMYGGNGQDEEVSREDAVREAVARATQRAQNAQRGQNTQNAQRGQNAQNAQRGQNAQSRQMAETPAERRNRDERRRREEQDGGWKKGASKTAKLVNRLNNRAAKAAAGEMTKGEKKPMPITAPKLNKSGGLSVNSTRSYRATVDGSLLKGNGKAGATNRYFHGEPSAAAKKVIGMLHKGHSKSGIEARNVSGINNAVKITLEEVTKGVRKADGKRFAYEYFGWRDQLSAEKAAKASHVAHDKNGNAVTISPTAINRAVPIRKDPSTGKRYTNATAAYNASTAIGAKIKANKK